MSEKYRQPAYRKQLSERVKKFLSENPHKSPQYLCAQKGYETSIEKKMRLALESEQISFETQFNIDRYWADFAILSSCLVIEVDGEYWHDKDKDAARDKIIESYGWQVIRFSETQVNKDIDSCIRKIEEIILLSR